MRIIEQRCDRCGKPTVATIVSMFNTQKLCLDCKDKERQHPMYEAARQAEEAACRSGNFNFKGIGKPSDL